MRSTCTMFILTALLLAFRGAPPVQADEPDQAAAKAARRELGAAQRLLDDFYKKCAYCDGKGQRRGVTCRDCRGEKRVYEGDYQKFLDLYLDFCDLIDKHADILKANEKDQKRYHEQRDRLLATIREQVGPQKRRHREVRGGAAYYRTGERFDGEYNKLARRLIAIEDDYPAGRGLACVGTVIKVHAEGDLRVAEVRLSAVGFTPPSCHVLLSGEQPWVIGAKIRVVGRIVPATPQREALKLPEKAVVVKPSYGTDVEDF